jgi:photosystem II stability/assembly factor-like uncharacterized protein
MKSILRGGLAAVALCAFLSACGGGGSSGPATLPVTVTITGAARVDTGSQQRFATDVANTSGLAFHWDFGDGATGSGATATHTYAKPGSYQVMLVVTAGTQDSRSATSTVQVAAFSNVAGLSCTQADSAGWCWQHAIVTGHQINDVFFVDANHAWAVGDASTILKTADGGNTWAQVALDASIPPASLTSVRFRDALHGMALGDSDFALQTNDGGLTWTTDILGGLVLFTPNPIAFADYGPTRIVVSSAYPGGSIASFDDGVTWSVVGDGHPVFTTATDCWNLQFDQLQRMAGCGATSAVSLAVALPGAPYDTLLTGAFGSATQGLLVGYDYASGAFGLSTMMAWSTTDAGATWARFAPVGLPSNASYSGMQLQMADPQTGLLYAPGDLWAYWTLDGGHNWSTVASSPLLTVPYTGYRATGFIDGSTMWQSSTNHISISTDRGATWHDATLAAEDIPTGHSGVVAATVAHFTDTNNYVVTMHQRFYATHDGGQTFTRILGPDSRDANSTSSAFFFDVHNGKILNSHGALLATADGGHTLDPLGSVHRHRFGRSPVFRVRHAGLDDAQRQPVHVQRRRQHLVGRLDEPGHDGAEWHELGRFDPRVGLELRLALRHRQRRQHLDACGAARWWRPDFRGADRPAHRRRGRSQRQHAVHAGRRRDLADGLEPRRLLHARAHDGPRAVVPGERHQPQPGRWPHLADGRSVRQRRPARRRGLRRRAARLGGDPLGLRSVHGRRRRQLAAAVRGHRPVVRQRGCRGSDDSLARDARRSDPRYRDGWLVRVPRRRRGPDTG